MRPAAHPQLLPPTSSLPPLRSLDGISEEQLFLALDNLYALYCPPLPPSFAFQSSPSSSCPGQSRKLATSITPSGASTPKVADSGYVSEDEDGEDKDPRAKGASAHDDGGSLESPLRADPFERSFAERWLTGFIARAEELGGCFSSDDARERALEQASCVLLSFFASTAAAVAAAAPEGEEESAQITREFSFELATTTPTTPTTVVEVRLNDGLAGSRSDDHTDVGLQSWGASIVFSELVCASPARFGLVPTTQENNAARGLRIVELGAGTGLASLVLASVLPRIGVGSATVIATDYHPAVLANLRANIATNFPSASSAGAVVVIDACQLDWSAPDSSLGSPPLDAAVPADVLIATDAVYAPEHAEWLRDCASRLLSPEGVFWLVATVRPNGKFEGISDTVKAAFTTTPTAAAASVDINNSNRNGRMLRILDEEWLEKRKGVGRGDESGYRLFRIGWA